MFDMAGTTKVTFSPLSLVPPSLPLPLPLSQQLGSSSLVVTDTGGGGGSFGGAGTSGTSDVPGGGGPLEPPVGLGSITKKRKPMISQLSTDTQDNIALAAAATQKQAGHHTATDAAQVTGHHGDGEATSGSAATASTATAHLCDRWGDYEEP